MDKTNQPQITDKQLVSWLRLARDNRFSISQKHQLLSTYLCPIEIYQTQYQELCAFVGVRADSKKDRIFRTKLDENLEKDVDWIQNANNHLVCWGDDIYPDLLAQISDPPLCLFVSGKLSLLKEPKISIVGSRRPTPVGAKITRTIATDLARMGIVITSGMALGIDAISHLAALDNNEPTIAVMGCGLDIISPARHRSLFERISYEGLVISEYPLGYPASRYTFPQRNRIVSGLSHGVVIVEAADKSGTLITARLAMEQNREVFVVPGSPVNPQYVGSHRLIQQGATLTTQVQDVLYELGAKLQKELEIHAIETDEALETVKKSEHNADEFPLLAHIDYHPTSINKIIFGSGLTASEVSSMLLVLEIEGLVAVTQEGSYIRVC